MSRGDAARAATSAERGRTPEVPAARGRALAAWLRLLGAEVRLILGRRRNQAGMLVLAAVPILITLALRASSRRGRGPDFFSQITDNGLFVALAALGVELTMFLPMAVATAAGDAIAGEAREGTLRYLLTVPVSRASLLLAKYVSLVFVGLVGALLVAVVGVVAGGLAFGLGDVTTLAGTQISLGAGLLRLGLVVLYLAAGLAGLAAVGLFVSTLTEQPIAVIVTVMVVAIASWLLDSIAQLDWLHPWLLVDAWPAYADLLREPPYLPTIVRGLLVDGAYGAVFGLAAWARFTSADVTS